MKRATAFTVVLLLAGCGGSGTPQAKRVQPRLPRALASAWRARADAVAAALRGGDGCAAQANAVALRTAVIQAVNDRRVSPRFQEPLTAAVNDLASRIACTPPPAPVPPAHGHGHGHDHGKHGKDGGGD